MKPPMLASMTVEVAREVKILMRLPDHPVGRSRNTAKPRAKRGRKSKLTTDRMEMFLECVRYGSTNKDACMVARISETTLYRWIEKGKHAKRGPHRKFCDSLETALAHFPSCAKTRPF